MSKLTISDKFQPLYKTAEDPDDGIRYVLIEGGRGGAKSFAVGSWVNHISYKEGWKILYTRYNMTSANLSVIPEFLEKSEEGFLDNEDHFDVFRGYVKNNQSDVEIIFKGLQSNRKNSVSLKSLNAVNVWIIDEAEELDDFELFDKIDNSIRTKKQKNLVVIILNPTWKLHWIYDYFYKDNGEAPPIPKRKDTLYINTSYLDNHANLNQSFINKALELKKKDLKRYEHIYKGAWLSKIEGALWDIDLINNYRRLADEIDAYKKIVVAIDPAVTNTEKSDETAICVAGVKFDDTYDILESCAGKWKPKQWALKALNFYHKYQANYIVGEVNNGGDLVEENLLNVSEEKFAYVAVRASRGKIVRAEPVHSLYDKGLVYHTKIFTKLEYEMVSFTGVEGEVSPNRLDAMVWAMFELAGLSRSALNLSGWKK